MGVLPCVTFRDSAWALLLVWVFSEVAYLLDRCFTHSLLLLCLLCGFDVLCVWIGVGFGIVSRFGYVFIMISC